MTSGERARPDAPPPQTLRWVERAAGRGYRVVRLRRLTVGIETATGIHRRVDEHLRRVLQSTIAG